MTIQPDDTWPPWCLRLFRELNAASERAGALAKPLTSRQLNWTPDAGAWSIGQCLEHLYISNEVYLQPMSSSLEGRKPGAVQEITPGWFGRWFIRSFIEPSPRTKRGRAPRKIRPGAQVAPDILDRFLDSNRRTRELVLRARNYDVNRIRFRNPFIPLIRFTIGTGLEIISKHQSRHLLQAERVRASPGFPA